LTVFEWVGKLGRRSTTGTADDPFLGQEYFGKDFRTIAEAMPQLVWTANGDGTIDYFNQRWIDYTGFNLEEFRGRGTKVGVVHADEVDETWARWKQAVASSTLYEQEYRLRRGSDGSYRWFLSRAAPIFGHDGKVSRWIGTATDIDEQRRARDSLSFMVEAGNALSTCVDVDAICKTLARITVGYFADWCFVTLVGEGHPETVAVEHRDRNLVGFVEQYRHRYPPRPGDALSRAVERNEPQLYERVLPEQIEAAARDEEHLQLLRFLQMQSVMIVPLAFGDTVFGVCSMVSAESGRLFNQTDLDVAKAVAARASTAIANARMLEAERRTAKQLRFTGRVNQLLFETSDPWRTMDRVAQMIASELADACAILRLRGDAIRTEIIVHSDPAINAIVGALRGQRTMRLAPEHEIADLLKNHETIVYVNEEPGSMRERAWPYLAAEVEALASRSSVIVPLHAGPDTYGALVAYYCQRPFDPDDVSLLEEIAARTSIAMEHAETLERERKIATTLQQALLPTLIARPHGIRFDAVYSPAADEGEVGGDWYDAIELDDGSVVVSVGDVTGRGIQAAAIMSKVRHAMGMVPLHETDPTKILDSAGWFLGKRYPNAIVTAFVAVVSAERTSLRFANAGHPLPILWRKGKLIELEATGLPLGLRTFAPPEKSSTIELCDGDILVLFTDGLIEARRDWAQGERLLHEVLSSGILTASVSPAKLIARACLPPQVHDDVAILTVSIGKPPAWTFSSEDARAAVDARGLFVEFLHGIAADDELVDRAELIFGELLGNVVRHAPGPVEISFDLDSSPGILHVIDSGPAFTLAPSHLPDDAFSELGRGLFIVQQLASDVRVDHIPNCGNHISVAL
jgi:PAS domain S-box-containing protein